MSSLLDFARRHGTGAAPLSTTRPSSLGLCRNDRQGDIPPGQNPMTAGRGPSRYELRSPPAQAVAGRPRDQNRPAPAPFPSGVLRRGHVELIQQGSSLFTFGAPATMDCRFESHENGGCVRRVDDKAGVSPEDAMVLVLPLTAKHCRRPSVDSGSRRGNTSSEVFGRGCRRSSPGYGVAGFPLPKPPGQGQGKAF